jgi:hypothetical protein
MLSLHRSGSRRPLLSAELKGRVPGQEWCSLQFDSRQTSSSGGVTDHACPVHAIRMNGRRYNDVSRARDFGAMRQESAPSTGRFLSGSKPTSWVSSTPCPADDADQAYSQFAPVRGRHLGPKGPSLYRQMLIDGFWARTLPTDLEAAPEREREWAVTSLVQNDLKATVSRCLFRRSMGARRGGCSPTARSWRTADRTTR